jgi:hypothetical protein
LVLIIAVGGALAVGLAYMGVLDREEREAAWAARPLRQVGAALDEYARLHGGRYPNHLHELTALGLLTSEQPVSGLKFLAPGRLVEELRPGDVVVIEPGYEEPDHMRPRRSLRKDGGIEVSRELRQGD